MESKGQLKEIDIKNRTCLYFDDIITDRDIYSIDFSDQKSYETYEKSYFMTFHIKRQLGQNY